MKKRFITSIFIVIITVLAIVSKILPHNLGDYVFDIFILFITMIASFEICNIMAAQKKKINNFLASMYCVVNYLVLIVCYPTVEFANILAFQVIGLFLYYLLILFVEFLRDRKTSMRQHNITALNTILACVYPAVLFCLFLNINRADFYAGVEYFSLVFIIAVFAITYLTDTFALLVGITFKGPKLAPKISPKKTISGAIGGLVGGVLGAMLVYILVYNVPVLSTILSMYSLSWWHFLLIGFFGSIFGQMGDLFESKLKRNANIKDSGDLFPGHGGMLDRIDAMIFVTTFMYVVITLILI